MISRLIFQVCSAGTIPNKTCSLRVDNTFSPITCLKTTMFLIKRNVGKLFKNMKKIEFYSLSEF